VQNRNKRSASQEEWESFFALDSFALTDILSNMIAHERCAVCFK